MAETVATSNFDEFKGKDCIFVADWLKTKGINMCCLINHVYMHISDVRSIIGATEK